MEIGAFTFADVALSGGVRPAQRIPELTQELAGTEPGPVGNIRTAKREDYQ